MWYGVPDSGAQDLEDLIKTEAPELFTKEPSLMHQLVTTLSPKLLHDKGVPVSTAFSPLSLAISGQWLDSLHCATDGVILRFEN